MDHQCVLEHFVDLAGMVQMELSFFFSGVKQMELSVDLVQMALSVYFVGVMPTEHSVDLREYVHDSMPRTVLMDHLFVLGQSFGLAHIPSFGYMPPSFLHRITNSRLLK